MLDHRIRPVRPPLAPYVEHLWMARGYLRAPLRNMILPDGAIELIINLGDPQKLCHPHDLSKDTVYRHSWISGERVVPIVIGIDRIYRIKRIGKERGRVHPRI